MATPTYTPLATITLSSSASSVTFSNISQSFRDLVVVVAGAGNTGATLSARFNSDSGSNYYRVYMGGNGSTTYSGADSGTSMGLQSGGSTSQKNFIWQIMDYSATDKQKTSLLRTNTADQEVTARAFRWANTSAVNQVQILADATGLASGAVLSLYGIAS